MLFLAFLSTMLVAADIPPSTSLSSSHAAYDGNALILTGHVVLDHGLGQMHAERASLQKQEMGTDFPFTVIELQKDVILHLKQSAKLSCGSANLDFTILKGFLSSTDEARVVFSDVVKKNIPITLTSRHAEISFSKNDRDEKKSDYDVETLLAKEDVVLVYNKAFTVYADRALYRKVLPQDNKAAPREFQGFISAYPKESALCRMTYEKDVIEADSMDVDLLHGKISMLRPKGTIDSSFFPKANENSLEFHSEHLVWDQTKNMVTLTGQAHLFEKDVGFITADEELRLVHAQRNGKNTLKSIHTKGKASLCYDTHQLICFGPINLDRDHLMVDLESPLVDGLVPSDKQICYEEGEVKIFGDKASMEYSLFGGTIHPVSLALKDHVRLYSKNAAEQKRFALADRLTYSPATRTFILTATPGKKVLFRDEENGMSVSAQEVHVTYDPETKKEKIQGIGSVKLLFSTDEINLLKKMFPSYE